MENKVFKFTEENSKIAKNTLKKYPEDKKNSAIMPLLTLAQRQNENYLSAEAIKCVADFLEIPLMEVLEVANFYSMYNLTPIGKYHFQVCNSVSCLIIGSEKLYDYIVKIAGIEKNNISKDGKFSIKKVECLGACVNASAIKINDTFIDDINEDNLNEIITNLKQDLPISLNKLVRKPIIYINE